MAYQDQLKSSIQAWLMRDTKTRDSVCLNRYGIGICTDIGVDRKDNQDRATIVRVQIKPDRFFVVAVLSDGMGGMKDGAICASMAVSTFLASCINNRNVGVEDRLLNAMADANSEVYKNYANRGGATLSAIVIDNENNAVAINVGDSRIYAHTHDGLIQLSNDDTLEGQLSKKTAAPHLKNQLLQYIGMDGDLEPSLINVSELTSLKNLVLTSDGAHYLEREVMLSLLENSDDPCLVSERVIKTALWSGSKDNATAVILHEPFKMLKGDGGIGVVSGTVHFWDSFGDLSLIGVERSPNRMPVNESPSHEPEQGSLLTDSDSSKVATKKKITRKKRSKKKKAKLKDELEEKPNIEVDFE